MADAKKDASKDADVDKGTKDEKQVKSVPKKEKTPVKKEVPSAKDGDKVDKKIEEKTEVPEEEIKEEKDAKPAPEQTEKTDEDLPKIKKVTGDEPTEEKESDQSDGSRLSGIGNQSEKEPNTDHGSPKTPAEESAKPKSHALLWIIAIILFLIVVGLFVYWWKYIHVTPSVSTTESAPTASTSVSATSDKSDTTKASTATTTASTKKSTTFEAALNAKDYNAIKVLLASTVDFALNATECCGKITPDQAITQLKGRIEDAGIDTYNFSPTQQIVQKMKTNQPQQFGKWNNIGISNGKDYIGYNVDASGKVSEVIMGFTDNLDLE